MIKHLLIAITLLAGCNGWFVPCDQAPPGTVYCTVSNDPPDGCEGEGQHTYYVWSLGAYCSTQQNTFCATDDASAQAYVTNEFADVGHGDASLDPHATEPKTITICAGPDCGLGSSDEALGTTFYYFTGDDLMQCEAELDQNCHDWVEADPSTNTCPGQ